MAAGDIIIPGNTITPEILDQIASEVQNRLASTSKDPGQYEEVNSLTGITSIPVFQQSGADYKLVRVLVSLLKGNTGATPDLTFRVNTLPYGTAPSVDKTGTAEAPIITIGLPSGKNGEKIIPVRTATGINYKYEGQADSEAQLLFSFAEVMPDVSDFSEAGIQLLQQPATEAATEVRQVMEGISQEATQLITTTTEAKDAAIRATEKAQSVSDHPGYIGEDYHVYTWDYATGAYNKTDTVLRPEGFSIFRTYPSIDAMNADKANVPEGKFVLINTGSVEDPDTARLYVKGPADFDYLVDMSGAIGFTGKTPQITIGTVSVGGQASATLSPDGTDDAGNPRFKLNLVIVAGPQGLMPVIELGTVSTGQPGTNASATFEQTGQTTDGRDKYLLNLTIPQGMPGTGSGNVLVDASGIMAGKKYLFVPNADGSPVGAFVEYAEPSVATAEKAGLMSPTQFQKLENLNPAFLRFLVEGLEKGRVGYESNATYLYNAARAKKVEYTDTGKLLFEGKEAFAVDADNELTLAGKKLNELGSNVNIISIPLSIANLNPSSSSDEIFTAWGGQQAMLDFVKNFGDSNVYGIYLKDGEAKMVVYPSVQIEYKDDANYSITIVIPSASGSMIVVFEITAGIASFSSVMPPTYVENSTNIHNTGDYIYLMYGKLNDSENDRRDIIFCNTADYQAVSAEPKHLAYSGSKSIRLENTGDGTKALMDDGTYKEITSGNTLGLDITPLLTGLVDPSQSFVITQEMFDSIVEAYTNRYQMAYVVVEGESAYFTMNISYNTANPRFFYDVSLFAPIAWGGAIGYCDYNIITFEVYEDDKSTTFNNCNIRLYSNGIGNRFLSDDGGYKEITVATISANGLLKQLNGSTTSFMRGDGTWATPPDTTYSPATQSANGLMSSTDKKKLDRIGSYTTATTVASLNANYEKIEISNLSANASLSVNLTGTAYNGWEILVAIYCSSARTITIPTTGNYISMIGSSLACPAGKWTELHLVCIGGKWRIAKLEQE